MEENKRLIGRVRVDSGQLVLLDPYYLENSEWQSTLDAQAIGVKFWGEGKEKVAVIMKRKGYEVETINHAYVIYERTAYLLSVLHAVLLEVMDRIPETVIHSVLDDSDYEKVCQLTCSEKQSGALSFKKGHEGLAVSCTTGFGDGIYDVVATFVDAAEFGERISKLEVLFITDEELEGLKK